MRFDENVFDCDFHVENVLFEFFDYELFFRISENEIK